MNIKFQRKSVYDQKHIKVKAKKFNGVVNTKFLGGEVPKEDVHYTCIACTSVDSVMNIEKKNYPQVYLVKYKLKMQKKGCLFL